ncbi:MAG: UvrD-helicase domain-containing protein [Rickettsiales bacterium]|jgi:DNA helicase-2/ATP-dependent DNA helicase PcrA|nr:UvrD-helicase domain-containing protein [Rickettsiales bacterium]
MEEVLGSLNGDQLAAVLYNRGPLLLLAGAGTGKTRVLVSKIAYLLENNFTKPLNLMAVTFTNRAADEMRRRVASLVGGDIGEMWIGTFHSVSARILREQGHHMGLPRNFCIVDQLGQLSLVRRVMLDIGLDPLENNPRHYVEMIGRIKNGEPGVDLYSLHRLDEVWRAYGLGLGQMNGCDFADLLLNVLKLLDSCAPVREYYNGLLEYLLVDEYQDSNALQRRWLGLMADTGRRKGVKLTCVGDDDQSIYGWRGAEVSHMLRFSSDYRGAKVLKLERNYRSTQHILTVASRLIAHNGHRHRKTLYSDSTDPGERVRLSSCNDMKQEAIVIAEEIGKLRESGSIGGFGEVAILVRTNQQTRILEEVLLKFRLPYRLVGATGFFERREIKDCLAFLRLASNPKDSLALRRVISLPALGLGAALVLRAEEFSDRYDLSLLGALSQLCSSGLARGRAQRRALYLLDRINGWHSGIKSRAPEDLLQTILRESGLVESFELDPTIEFRGKMENLEELLDTLSDFPSTDSFLAYVNSLSTRDGDSSGGAVDIMTIHAAKGLEFGVVFLPNWQEGIFPHPWSLEEPAGLEEERRLAYVAMTRAQRKLYLSYSLFRYENREVISLERSRFIDELPEENLETQSCELDSRHYREYYSQRWNHWETATPEPEDSREPEDRDLEDSRDTSSAGEG